MKKITALSIAMVFNLTAFAQTETEIINKANDLIANKKYETAFKLLQDFDARNEKPDVVLLKEDIALNYFVTSIMHEIFALKDLEKNEDIIKAVQREVYEETAWHFEPEHLIAIQLWRKTPLNPTFVRFTFSGRCHSYNPTQPLDVGIIATHWLNRDQIAEKNRDQLLRSPLVLISIDEYLSGQRYPLSLIKSFLDN